MGSDFIVAVVVVDSIVMAVSAVLSTPLGLNHQHDHPYHTPGVVLEEDAGGE
jgi:hypothetical protein